MRNHIGIHNDSTDTYEMFDDRETECCGFCGGTIVLDDVPFDLRHIRVIIYEVRVQTVI